MRQTHATKMLLCLGLLAGLRMSPVYAQPPNSVGVPVSPATPTVVLPVSQAPGSTAEASPPSAAKISPRAVHTADSETIPEPERSTIRPNLPTANPDTLPLLHIETIVPKKANLGRPMHYEIIVRNLSRQPIQHVRVEDRLPEGVDYLGGDPAIKPIDGRMMWNFGTMEAESARRIRVEVRPLREGIVMSEPTVTFSASAKCQTQVTTPRLKLAVHGPDQVEVGQPVRFDLQLENIGDGVANRILLRAKLSKGLKHPQGSVIEAELGSLQPQESKTITLRTQSGQRGVQTCTLLAKIVGHPGETQADASVRVLEPQLVLHQDGPSEVLVHAEPEHLLTISNPGSTPTGVVTVETQLPDELAFVSADHEGRWDEESRSVVWQFNRLAPKGSVQVRLRSRARRTGKVTVKSVASSGPRLQVRRETPLQIDGIPAVRFEVVDLEDVIPVGKETTYEVRIVNQGTCACTNIRLTAVLTEGLKPTAIRAPMGHRIEGNTLIFEPYERLATKADTVLRVRVRGTAAGDQRFRVQLICDEITQPITKEEATRFYQP